MHTDSEVLNPLPPILCNNLRHKVGAEKVSLQMYKERHKTVQDLAKAEKEKPTHPVPLHPLHISSSPDHLCFDVDEETVICKLTVCNPGDRTVYMRCCGLCDESARLGASWWCFPRTRFILAPGLNAVISIKARPKESAPTPFAHTALRLAAAHLRDTAVGHFEVPIFVKFLKYVPPAFTGEE